MVTAVKEALLARREGTATGFPEGEVDIPGIGTVRVRGLSRHEILHIQNAKGPAAVEQMTVSLGLIEPAMTEAEVKAWQKVSVGGELDPVTKAIGGLSGMFSGAAKSGVPGDGDEPGSGVRVFSGEQAGDDGGPAPDGGPER